MWWHRVPAPVCESCKPESESELDFEEADAEDDDDEEIELDDPVSLAIVDSRLCFGCGKPAVGGICEECAGNDEQGRDSI